jgi:cell filamentation protein, protein adenylyltransferase
MDYSLPKFPPPQSDLETPQVLRQLIRAHRSLAELKGIARTMPNPGLLLSTLSLQEAQSSSEIENIITTQDALFRQRIQPEKADAASKEVARYVQALLLGLRRINEHGVLSLRAVREIQSELDGNSAGFRKLPGTVLQNDQTGELIFAPPDPDRLPALLSELEQFLNQPQQLDPLVCMALAHHRFETIHPFYDGNGRTGRILNVLYLVKEGLLDQPILYLSRYINQTKNEYYRLLQASREDGDWESWLLYVLRGVDLTAQHTTGMVKSIGDLLLQTKHQIRSQFRFYSQDLINSIFQHPYTKIAFLEADLQVSRQTAARYLDALVEGGVLTRSKLGRVNYYVNHRLVDLLFHPPPFGQV